LLVVVVVVSPPVPFCPFAPTGGIFCWFEEGGRIPIPTASVVSLATWVVFLFHYWFHGEAFKVVGHYSKYITVSSYMNIITI
jgi:hypothetical protein